MAKHSVNFTAVDEKDLLGNDGAIADASWSEIWTRWDDVEREKYFAEAARWGVLNRSAARALIQGQPPPPVGWSQPVGVLAENEAHVCRFECDVERGAVAPRVTPMELVRWCHAHAIQLPEPFVDGVEAKSQLNSSCIAPVTDEDLTETSYAPWFPAPVNASRRTAQQKQTRGRPATKNEDYSALREAGKIILMDAARAGKTMTLAEVAAKLKKTAVGSTMAIDSIVARLKQHLPVKTAKQTAAQVRGRTR